MLVADRVDRTTKDAISAVLSQINDCPYCEDMLISLVHAGGEHGAANDIFDGGGFEGSDETLRRRLEWVRAIASPRDAHLPPVPFTPDQLPEVIGTLMGMSDINRFSHVIMQDSPVGAPLGLRRVKSWLLRVFGSELEATRRTGLAPGRALALLPPAELPADMRWAEPNPRVADAVARWAATVEREGARVIPARVRNVVSDALSTWEGEPMPLDGRWVDDDLGTLVGEERAIARLAIVVAKASYRVTDAMVVDVLGEARDEARFIRILAWASFTAARRFARVVARKAGVAEAAQGLAVAA